MWKCDGEILGLLTFSVATSFIFSTLAEETICRPVPFDEAGQKIPGVSFKRAVYGDSTLGDQLDLFSLGSLTITTTSAGSVELFELSFEFSRGFQRPPSRRFCAGKTNL